MLIIRPIPSFLRRSRVNRIPPMPPTALTLLAATYQSGAWIELSFSYAIDISELDGAAIFVEDGPGGVLWIAIGSATQTGSTSVRIGLVEFESASGSAITLTAPATTGIRVYGGSGTWAGVTNVALPFG